MCADRADVPRTAIVVRGHRVGTGPRREAGDLERVAIFRAAENAVLGIRHARDAPHARHAIGQVPDQRAQPLAAITTVQRVHADHEEMIAVQSDVGVLDAAKTAHQQARAHQQHQRHGDLRRDEQSSASQPAASEGAHYVSSCRTMRERPAPIASRMPISRPRTTARASSRLATLAQMMSSSRPTPAMSVYSGTEYVSRTRENPFAPHDTKIGNSRNTPAGASLVALSASAWWMSVANPAFAW